MIVTRFHITNDIFQVSKYVSSDMTDISRGETRQLIERLAVLLNTLLHCIELVNEIRYGDRELSIIITTTELT